MKEANEPEDMLPEYDFSQGVRGKYAQRAAEKSNIVALSPDIAEAFPSSEAVNEALRALLNIARQTVKKTAEQSLPPGFRMQAQALNRDFLNPLN